MTYQETLDYLYSRLPMFHRIGPAAFKKDLTNTLALCAALGQPQEKFKSIHIAGTNGKGSTSHMLASVLQAAGYKVGLYTSPHLVDFRERIRINGQMVPEEFVTSFIEKNRDVIEEINPSFFEATVALAFDHFAQEKVDIAVIETGLGGRLDSTNVITPLLSIITNISYDHQNMLGNTLPEIAGEKAGIIKTGIPVVIGKRQPETEPVFAAKARETTSPIHFAEDLFSPLEVKNDLQAVYMEADYKDIADHSITHIQSPLRGTYQLENIATVLSAAKLLNDAGIPLPEEAVLTGIREVRQRTSFRGRWEVLGQKPFTVCDVAHNEAGLRNVFQQVAGIRTGKEQFRIVYGMVNDKDIQKALALLPKDAVYYFCRPDIPRGLDVNTLRQHAAAAGLTGSACASVVAAFHQAQQEAVTEDIVLVTGSIFVVAEVLAEYPLATDRQPLATA